ncbi:ribokinase [Humisphaera borealis]|uniref:Ribokinase n=1 Tax=Humisphaera borealis TaxID=2807512 RepID=A0A7M2X0E4_9BACT|nr:ribokinase [Humisphaera borealis]QOV91119.1 ribokinase [Humisphaera borealis]
MPRRQSIVVVGSINIDFVTRVERFPQAGETVAGGDLQLLPGGKGANQAVAAARLGGDVFLVGRVGDDPFGPDQPPQLAAHGVDVTHVKPTVGVRTGSAMILVDADGRNCIVVSPGANGAVSSDDLKGAEPIIADAAVVLAQLETPIAVVVELAAMCRRLGTPMILDPAPAPAHLPPELFAVDAITPNRSEALRLAGHQPDDVVDPEVLAWKLLELGARAVVLKLDKDGALVANRDGVRHIPAFKAEVVDTTAAGDAFNGALAVMLANGATLDEAACFANAAGAIACEKQGAIPSLPTLEEVERRLGS